MREGWEYKKLVDKCSILYGYPFDSKFFSSSNEDMPLIRIRDVKEGKTSTYYKGNYPKEYIIHKGDFLIGMDGEFNISAWQSDDALLNQRVCKIERKNSDVSMRFIYRFLTKELKRIEDETPYVTVKHLSAKRLNQINLPVPPLPEQERIVSELDLLSSVIEKKKAQLHEYDQLAQSIFYDMFGDPVTNEKGWEVKKLGDEFEVSSGGTPSTGRNEFWDNGNISWIGSNMCQNQIIYENDGKYITKEGLEHSSAKLYHKGFVLVALVGATIGKVALLGFETTTNQNIAGINVPNNKDYTSLFIYYLIQSLYYMFENIGEGKFKMANLSFIRSLPIIKPLLTLQQQFASKIEAIEKQKEQIRQSIAEVETLFNSRMDYYFG
ncbi:MAG: restriction endonuclease subunit S [Prevotella sp.]|nr:restriction endonuclease subunit S [Prevotella sp.]MBR6264782.1 restriction endonuclease subunit S [Prevotella sp.]